MKDQRRKKRSTGRLFTFIATTLLITGPYQNAFADENSISDFHTYEEISITINLKGINLGTAEGAQVAIKKTKNAVKKICSPSTGAIRNLKMKREYNTCFDDAYSVALLKLNKLFNTDVLVLAEENKALEDTRS